MPPTTRRANPAVIIELSSDDSSDDELPVARSDTFTPPEIQTLSDDDGAVDDDDLDIDELLEEVQVQEVQIDFTEQDCLDRVLEMFPDIAHDHVRQLYRERPNAGVTGARWCQQMIERILECGEKYPRQKREERKRKRGNSIYESEEAMQWENADRDPAGSAYAQAT